MKKLLLVALAVTTLTACRKDDDKNEETSKIVGTWKPVKDIAIDIASGDLLETYIASECTQKRRVEFKNNGDFTNSYYNNDSGVCELQPIINGTYTYDSTNNKITAQYQGNEETSDIVKLTNNELQLITDHEDVNNDGVLDNIIIVFQKVN